MFSQYLKNGASTIQQILTEHRLWVRHCFRLSVNKTNPTPPPPKADDTWHRDCFFVIFLRYEYLHQKQYILLPLLFTQDFEYEVKLHIALEQDKHLVPSWELTGYLLVSPSITSGLSLPLPCLCPWAPNPTHRAEPGALFILSAIPWDRGISVSALTALDTVQSLIWNWHSLSQNVTFLTAFHLSDT